MREYVRRHPWRLEIVPFLIFTLAVVLPLPYRHEALIHVHLRHGMTATQVWGFYYAFRLLFVAGSWYCGFLTNHTWVQRERAKKVNYRVWRVNGLMVLMGGWLIWFVIQPAVLWFTLGAALWCIGVLIEHARPFVPEDDGARAVPAAEHVRPGDPFYYKEERASPWYMLTISVLGSGPGALAVWFYTGQPWAGALVVGAMMSLMVFLHGFFYRAFTASGERITARVGLFRKVALPMADVRSCSLLEYDPPVPDFRRYDPLFGRFDGMLFYGWWWTSRRGLLVEMSDGEKYLFAIDSPETACRLIQSALAARG